MKIWGLLNNWGMTLWGCLNKNAGAIGIIVAVVGIAFAAIPVITYYDLKKQELRADRFRTYHLLIKQLVEPDDKNCTYIDRQIAVAYELKNFPEYKDPTVKILEGFCQKCGSDPKNKGLRDEMISTISELKKRK